MRTNWDIIMGCAFSLLCLIFIIVTIREFSLDNLVLAILTFNITTLSFEVGFMKLKQDAKRGDSE